MNNKPREHWSSRLGFVMAAAGSAIGLGTLWKFPYVTGENGGGAFILVYILCTLFIGIPLFIGELLVGRAGQKSAVPVFGILTHVATPWRLAGWLGVISSFLIMSFYSVIAGWGLNYVLMSLNQFYAGCSPEEIGQLFETLSQSGDITLFWHAVFTAISVSVVFRGIRRGVEHWSKLMTSLLLILVSLLFCFNLTLDGFQAALHFVFTPDFSKLHPSSILEALGLSLFTLSLGQAIMLTYGSYMNKSDDVPKTSLIVSSMVIVVSLLCAMTIFPIMFTFNMPPQAGFGLVFKTLPVLFAKLPGSLLLSTLFFTLFSFSALTSAIAFVEVIVATLIDLYDISRRRAAIIVGVSLFVFGIPSALSFSKGVFCNWEELYGKTFFETINTLTSVWLLPLGGLLTSLFIGWKLDPMRKREEFMQTTTLGWMYRPWRFMIRYLVPAAIIVIILQHMECINIDMLFQTALTHQ